MKKYKAILFDYDGTIMDTNMLVTNSWQHVARTVLGHEAPSDYILKTFGIPLDEVMDKFAEDFGIKEGGAYCTEIYRNYQLDHVMTDMKPFEGTEEMLKALREKGAKLGIVTSRVNSSLIDGLTRFGIYDYFDAIIGSEDTNIHKPNPEPALMCCERLGVDPSDCLMVGDSVYDLQCGHNAGTDACFVKWSYCTKLETAIELANPEYIAESVSSLVDFA